MSLGDPRREVTQRIVESRVFSKSSRLRDFLAFVVAQALSGNSAEVTEIEIARRIFGRGADFVPSDDSVVRVSARQLRTKLKEYFDGEGKFEPLLIQIPKGAYVPVFSPRQHPAAPTALPPSSRSWRLAGIVFLIANVMFLGANLWWSATLKRGAGKQTPATVLSSLFFNDHAPVTVVVSDFGLSLLRFDHPAKFGVDEYATWDYANLQPPRSKGEQSQKLFDVLRSHRITRLGDLTTSLAIERAADDRVPLLVRHARDVSIRDFKRGHYILLGNPYSTPWVELFESRLNFVSVRGPEGVGYRNRKPRQGEQAVYTVRNAQNEQGLGYGRVAFVPNGFGPEGILLISGVNMTSMEAAGEFTFDPNSLSELLAALSAPRSAKLPYFEVLLETNSVDNTPQRPRILASRIINAAATRLPPPVSWVPVSPE